MDCEKETMLFSTIKKAARDGINGNLNTIGSSLPSQAGNFNAGATNSLNSLNSNLSGIHSMNSQTSQSQLGSNPG